MKTLQKINIVSMWVFLLTFTFLFVGSIFGLGGYFESSSKFTIYILWTCSISAFVMVGSYIWGALKK